MRHYEVMIILDPSLDERTVAPSLENYLNVIRTSGGTVEKVDVWGKRRLAYEINKHAEGIYGATEMTRRCLAEMLAERVDRGDLREEHARHIGRQILRDNALALFPQLKDRLWKHKGITMKPPKPAHPRSPAR